MKQIIKRKNITVCVTSVPYPKEIIRDMKQAGYVFTVEKVEKGGTCDEQ